MLLKVEDTQFKESKFKKSHIAIAIKIIYNRFEEFG